MNRKIFSTFSKLLPLIAKYLLLAFHYIFPTRLITTFFGIGYLPEWQDHWSTFFAIVFFTIVLHFTVGIDADLLNITEELFMISLFLAFLSWFSIKLFRGNDKTVKYEITIHLVFGQILTIALSMPGIITFKEKMEIFDTALCNNIIYCTPWFLDVIIYFPTMLFPYFVFQLSSFLKPWPAYWIDKNFHDAVGNTVLGFFNAVYATIFIYFVAFIFLDLVLIDVIDFYNALFKLIGLDLKYII